MLWFSESLRLCAGSAKVAVEYGRTSLSAEGTVLRCTARMTMDLRNFERVALTPRARGRPGEEPESTPPRGPRLPARHNLTRTIGHTSRTTCALLLATTPTAGTGTLSARSAELGSLSTSVPPPTADDAGPQCGRRRRLARGGDEGGGMAEQKAAIGTSKHISDKGYLQKLVGR